MLPFPISANPAHTTPGIWVTELNGGDHAGSAPLFLIFIPPLHFSKLSGNFRQSMLTLLLHSPCCSAHRLLWLAGTGRRASSSLSTRNSPGTRVQASVLPPIWTASHCVGSTCGTSGADGIMASCAAPSRSAHSHSGCYSHSDNALYSPLSVNKHEYSLCLRLCSSS